jgi:thioredoxin 1
MATGSAPVADKVQQALTRGKPTVVEFGSNGCAGCMEMKPVLAELARTHGDRLVVADVDVLKETRYIGQYQIKLMPTQVFYNAQGLETSRHLGKISAADMAARLGLMP